MTAKKPNLRIFLKGINRDFKMHNIPERFCVEGEVSWTGFGEVSGRCVVLSEDFEAERAQPQGELTGASHSLHSVRYWRLQLKWKLQEHSQRTRDELLRCLN